MKARRLTAVLLAGLIVMPLAGACSGDEDSKQPSLTREADPTGATRATDGPVDDRDGDGAPGAPDEHGRQGEVLDRVPGQPKRKCVDVGGRRDVRSGGIMAGAWDEARNGFGQASPDRRVDEVRLYWVPLHANEAKGLTVVASRGNDEVQAEVPELSQAESWLFYSTLIRLDGPGTWTFRATTGADSGCFRATFE